MTQPCWSPEERGRSDMELFRMRLKCRTNYTRKIVVVSTYLTSCWTIVMTRKRVTCIIRAVCGV